MVSFLQPVADWLKQFIQDINLTQASSLSMSVGLFLIIIYYFYLFELNNILGFG